MRMPAEKFSFPPTALDKWRHLFGCFLIRHLQNLHNCQELVVSSHLRLSLQDMDKEENSEFHPYWVQCNMKETKLKPSSADAVEENFYRNGMKRIYEKYSGVYHIVHI